MRPSSVWHSRLIRPGEEGPAPPPRAPQVVFSLTEATSNCGGGTAKAPPDCARLRGGLIKPTTIGPAMARIAVEASSAFLPRLTLSVKRFRSEEHTSEL